MIPPFDASGKLPPGVHWATWAEFVFRFGVGRHRRRLLKGLRLAMDHLAAAGCQTIFVNGSFVTKRSEPGDFDACWDRAGVVADRLGPVILAYAGERRDQKRTYGGELFPTDAVADPLSGATFLEYFQMDKFTRRPKGIVAIRLGGAP